MHARGVCTGGNPINSVVPSFRGTDVPQPREEGTPALTLSKLHLLCCFYVQAFSHFIYLFHSSTFSGSSSVLSAAGKEPADRLKEAPHTSPPSGVREEMRRQMCRWMDLGDGRRHRTMAAALAPPSRWNECVSLGLFWSRCHEKARNSSP